MSLRASRSVRPAACSGDMYGGEPRIAPWTRQPVRVRPQARLLHQAEVEQLGHVVDAAALADDDVATA